MKNFSEFVNEANINYDIHDRSEQKWYMNDVVYSKKKDKIYDFENLEWINFSLLFKLIFTTESVVQGGSGVTPYMLSNALSIPTESITDKITIDEIVNLIKSNSKKPFSEKKKKEFLKESPIFKKEISYKEVHYVTLNL